MQRLHFAALDVASRFACRGWGLCFRRVFTIELTQHCVERFRDRVRPALSVARAEEELVRCLGLASVQAARPSWVLADADGGNDCFVVISDGVVLPLEATGDKGVLVAPTCLIRSDMSEETRRRRNAARSARRRWRRSVRREEAARGERHPREREMVL